MGLLLAIPTPPQSCATPGRERREKKTRSKGKKKTEMALSQSVLSSRCRSGFDVLSKTLRKITKNMDVAAEEVNTHFLARTHSKNLMKAPYTTE